MLKKIVFGVLIISLIGSVFISYSMDNQANQDKSDDSAYSTTDLFRIVPFENVAYSTTDLFRIAAFENDDNTIQSLLNSGLDINEPFECRSALQGVSLSGDTTTKHKVAAARLLLDYGAQVFDQKNDNTVSPTWRLVFAGIPLQLATLILGGSIINPIRTTADRITSQDRIISAILTLKKVCPQLGKNLTYLILLSNHELQEDILSCSFDIHKGHPERAPYMPFATLKACLAKKILLLEPVVEALKNRYFEILTPWATNLFPPSLFETVRFYSPVVNELRDLLKPENIKSYLGPEVETHIHRRLGTSNALLSIAEPVSKKTNVE